MPLVVELGAVVCDAQFLNTPDCARVFDCDSGVICDGPKKEFILLVHLQVDAEQLYDSKNTVNAPNRQANDGAVIREDRVNGSGIDPGIMPEIGDDEWLACRDHPCRETLCAFEPHVAQSMEVGFYGSGITGLASALVQHDQRPGSRLKVGGHLLHDGFENDVEVKRRREGFRHIVEDAEVVEPRLRGRRGDLHGGTLGLRPYCNRLRREGLHKPATMVLESDEL